MMYDPFVRGRFSVTARSAQAFDIAATAASLAAFGVD
jgi:hypothetical protein